METNKKRTKEEIIEEYQQLKKEKNSWWNVLASERNSVKTILGAFILYIGYIIILSLNSDVFVLLYAFIVIGVLLFWIDMLRKQYEQHRSAYNKRLRVLNKEIRRISKKKIIDSAALSPIGQRNYFINKSLFPYLQGYPSESIRQYDEFIYQDFEIYSVEVDLENLQLSYWFMARETAGSFSDEQTFILPLPFHHDQLQIVEFNKEICPSEFTKDFRIQSSNFMHAYEWLNETRIQNFLALKAKEKWMALIQGKEYILISRNKLQLDIQNLDKASDDYHAAFEVLKQQIDILNGKG